MGAPGLGSSAGSRGICAASLLLALAAGCTTASAPSGQAGNVAAFSGPVTYSCEDDMRMTVERNGPRVSVHSPRGLDLDLPASPPGQDARFGEALYAVVLEGKEALWMVNGKTPISCTR
ncbi:hypothetical protein NA2_10113 [Nitratireductor pacificus pht-3B]|uniref:C-type lysozyme inhibitor domain-containing protein n=2 Tax=Nitratireductor TaxID=245876 RepID=K2LN08_9HYPH|nr:hypothetical protein NA2_10113 [Nitratireductor pacificus pht-3B]